MRIRLKAAFAVAALLTLAGSPRLQAATINVTSNLDNGTACTLREAIQAIEGAADANGCNHSGDAYGTNDMVTFAAGLTITLGSALPDITRDLTIAGNGTANTIVQASDCDPVAGICTPADWRVFTFTGGSLILKDMTIRNGNCVNMTCSNGDAGGNVYTTGSLTLDGVHVERGNSSSGGGVYSIGGSLVLQNSAVVGGLNAGNSSAEGGGIWLQNAASLSIDDSQVAYNTASQDAAGIYMDEVASAIIQNGSSVDHNVGMGDGGGLYLSASANPTQLTVDASTIGDNEANSGGNGGGLFVNVGAAEPSSILFENGSLVANNSADYGGGIHVVGGANVSLAIDASTVSHNHATPDDGGGIRFSDNSPGTLTIANGSLIDQNTAANDGGGIYLGGTGSSASITGSTVSGNTVDGDNGAGVYVSDSTLLVDNSRITSNTAYDYAGGIELSGGSLTIQNGSMIDHNAANIDYGGGINAEGSGCELTIDASTISDNMSVDRGGGIWTSCTTNISASTFSGNMSGNDGGGIFSFAGATTTISNSTFSGNMATGDGGGIYGDGSPLSVINVTLSGNSGTTGGGISSTGTGLTLKNSILANSLSGADCHSSSALAADVNNVVMDNSGCGTPVSTADPMLGTLADNGGPTPTMALPPDSPAVDAGDDATCAAAPVNNLDQRGLSRLQGLHCDIGAFEFIDTIFKDGFDGP